MLVIGALLLLSAGFSIVSLSRLNQEVQAYQTETLDRGEQLFTLHQANLREKLEVWVESFVDQVNLQDQGDFSVLKAGLKLQFDALQLHYNVESLWLLNESNQVLYSSKVIPKNVLNIAFMLLDKQAPQQQVYCDISCELLLTIPVLNKKGEMAVVAISISLIDLIYKINESLKSDVAVVSFAKNSQATLDQAHIVTASNTSLIQALFFTPDIASDVNNTQKYGTKLELASGHYLINLMSLSANEQREFYIALIDDVTSITVEYEVYRRQFLLSALIIFITLAILVYFVASPLTNRLLVLSDVLPLLAQKKFDQFRRIKIKRKRLFADELDILAEATTDLSYELEQLNIEVDEKTKELENIAHYDVLTGLPNRNMLNEQLRKSVADLTHVKQKIAVLFLDLDDFRKVNDSHGHSEGDRLLIEAANRVSLSIRDIDLACRFGGDEFVIVLGKIASIDEAVQIAENILQRFKLPIKIDNSIFYVSTSIGIAVTDDKRIKAEALVSYADIAMYEAKDKGGAQYHVYHPEMYQQVAHRVLLEGDVRQALAKNQFSLSLQPQIKASDNSIYGFEALLRWSHPTRGPIPPDDFIPILENSAYMIELGYWIIRRCFELSVAMQAQGLMGSRIAINLSAGQFVDQNLPSYLHSLLAEFSLTPSCFEFELTEQTLVKDVAHTIEMMESLKKIGFSFAIDDFGTGYSSLTYLKQMPVDVIKIDKSFILGMLENHSDYQIIMSTISMVKNLGLMVVAEGVETSPQLACLVQNDCDIIQGYYFSKPIPEADFIHVINRHIVDGVWNTKAIELVDNLVVS
jgi:diguanylate cyclase (GGDEF)-like protein